MKTLRSIVANLFLPVLLALSYNSAQAQCANEGLDKCNQEGAEYTWSSTSANGCVKTDYVSQVYSVENGGWTADHDKKIHTIVYSRETSDQGIKYDFYVTHQGINIDQGQNDQDTPVGLKRVDSDIKNPPSTDKIRQVFEGIKP